SARAGLQFPTQRAAPGKIEQSVPETQSATHPHAIDIADRAGLRKSPPVLACTSRTAAFRRGKERAPSAKTAIFAGIVCRESVGSNSSAGRISPGLLAANKYRAERTASLLLPSERGEPEIPRRAPELPEYPVLPATNPLR